MQHNILLLALAAILGVAIHFLLKANSMKKRAKGKFSFMDFLAGEILYLIMMLCYVAVLLIAQQEIMKLKIAGYAAGEYLYLAFALFGMAGSSIIYKIAGATKKWEKEGLI